MYKNQLQELAQRSCFNLPSYACTREGPDHAPRFKACVNFNGEVYESPSYCTTLRQAEHAAAEVALNNLSTRGPSRSLTARVLDETGVYKNLLQETAHRAGLKLPVYTTVRSGPGHVPVFTCSVKLAGMEFTGESAKTKKQAEKNAAIAAWSSLKTMPNLVSLFGSSRYAREEHEQEQNSARRRDVQNQGGGRRMVRGQRDAVNIGCGSSNSSNRLQQHHDQQRRLVDLLMLDSSSSAPAVALSGEWNANPVTPMKQKLSFVSLLPPPPPRASSKILPPLLSSTPTRPGPPHHVKGKEVPPPYPLDEHQKDEDEWLNNCGNSENKNTTIPISKLDQIPGKSATSRISYRTNPAYRNDYEQTHNIIRANLLRAPAQITSSQLMGAISSSINNLPTNRGRYNYNPNGNGMAPAVQKRSVIPVCAAAVRAPLPHTKRPPTTSNASPLVKETTDLVPLAAAAKASSSELGSAQVSSVFKDYLQL